MGKDAKDPSHCPIWVELRSISFNIMVLENYSILNSNICPISNEISSSR